MPTTHYTTLHYTRCAIYLLYQLHRLLGSKRYKKTQEVIQKLKDDARIPEQERSYFIKFLQHNLVKTFNYSFAQKYELKHIPVKYDKTYKLPYVVTAEKHKLYFPAQLSNAAIRSKYNGLCVEQDEHSPHNYCFGGCPVTSDTILADVGSAEGNFSLKFINQVKRVYLFEYSEGWQDALKATFAPWADKVVIVKKYVSNKNDKENISLDEYFIGKEKPTLIKIDVEGAENQVLQGAHSLLEKRDTPQLLVATYHRQDDEHDLAQMLQKYGYSISLSGGYMLFQGEFRRGLLRAF